MTKVLSIRQPWASMIVRGLKRFEVRSWSTEYRGQLIIHASSAAPTKAFAEAVFKDDLDLGKLMSKVGMSSLDDLRALPRSAIVGAVTLHDVLDSDQTAAQTTVDDASVLGELAGDNSYWLLKDAIEIVPITNIDGKLNLWELDDETSSAFKKRITIGTHATFKSTKSGAASFKWTETSEDDMDDDSVSPMLIPSPELAAIVGSRPMTRPDVVKKLWAYIKKNDLQDKKNLRTIHADEKLKKIVGRAKIDIFKLTSKVSAHLRVE